MAERRLTRRELVQRQRAEGFVGRRAELSAFADNLGRDPQDAAFRFLFHVHGQGGVGKTTLIRRWEQLARDHGAVTVMVGDGVHSALEAMEAVGVQLARQQLVLKDFDKRLAEYRQRRHEAETALALGGEPAAEGPPASPGSTLAAQAGLAALSAVPVVGALAGALDAQQLAQGGDRLRAAAARLRRPEDVQLVTAPLKVLTPLFLEGLAEAARRSRLLVLFFDVYERTAPVLEPWLPEVIFGGAHGDLEANVVVVLAGQGRLAPRHWADWQGQVTGIPLEIFSEEETRGLLAARGLTDETTVEAVLRLSGRLPVLVDMLAQARPAGPGEVPDPSETAVDRFLKWVPDPSLRAAALLCALPLALDEDLHRLLAPEPAGPEGWAWLRSLPFVQPAEDGRVRYHDTVRALMLRHQRTRSAASWREYHARLAGAYAERRRALETTLTDDETRWEDPAWREARRSETYHRLCADPRQALTAALRETVDACDQGPANLRRWAQVLRQAAEDTDDDAIADWARRLEGAAAPGAEEGDGRSGVIAALTCLLAAPRLPAEDQALVLAIRGREHRESGATDRAMADYDRALALHPTLARAFAGRGVTHWAARRPEEALADLDRAIALDADDSWALSSRGEVLSARGRHDEAAADFSRVIELEDDYAWAFAQRGEAHRMAGRPEEALADLNRAVELVPDYAWALASRGETHRVLGHYDEALADFDRAVELDDEYAWALAQRGETHLLAGRLPEALSDLNRALQLEPDHARALAQRGETHRLADRLDEALADFDRAVELQPDYAWAIASRGQTYRALGRPEEALADIDRALALRPGMAWALVDRGIIHRLAGRYDEAVADFDRALGLDPGRSWILAQRGETHRLVGRFEEAVADFDRAIELDPEHVWTIASRGQTYQALGRLEEALADFDRALGLDADRSWVLAQRGETHRLSDRYEDALADFDRAVALDPDYVWAIASRGQTYQALGRFEEALADFDRALGLDADREWVVAVRGLARCLVGRYGDALADVGHALRLDPEDGGNWLTLALVRRLAGEPEEREHWCRAEELLTAKAAGEGPEALDATADLVLLACALPDPERAQARVAALLDRDPVPWHLRHVLDDLRILRTLQPAAADLVRDVGDRLREALNARGGAGSDGP
ncbi:tetratricopeptide repeat protein [Streptomyces sp. DSM 44917]|uniref:Tetratricopeptide repeat protein n=1 Tax=Streptomyces boetiae TaxID=3075541 RepID=A0ABU2L4F6_9ACTN|nr:tetratricopeptide repeat protein [Streptomyces sp. DSM 44917]MDT0306208.1 tetratricopeptide repeat protein [Streptomyces sp. DSM 44917]